jgi:hypothetical protein
VFVLEVHPPHSRTRLAQCQHRHYRDVVGGKAIVGLVRPKAERVGWVFRTGWIGLVRQLVVLERECWGLIRSPRGQGC